jgi:hypothetical protein
MSTDPHDPLAQAVLDSMEATRRAVEAEIRPVAEQVIADAVRPWRKAVFWLALGYAVMAALSIAQWVVTR